jgi:hypothetical protein
MICSYTGFTYDYASRYCGASLFSDGYYTNWNPKAPTQKIYVNKMMQNCKLFAFASETFLES